MPKLPLPCAECAPQSRKGPLPAALPEPSVAEPEAEPEKRPLDDAQGVLTKVNEEAEKVITWTAEEGGKALNWTAEEVEKARLKAEEEAEKARLEAEKAVKKVEQSFSATTELIETTLRASSKAAAAMLSRIAENDMAKAVNVLIKLIHSNVGRASVLMEGQIKLSTNAAGDLLVALMDTSKKSSMELLATLIENSPSAAVEVISELVDRSGTHAKLTIVHRARNGMPLLTQMLPQFVPMLRESINTRLKQKNVGGGIKLGKKNMKRPGVQEPFYYLRFVRPGRTHPRTEFGRRLQAEMIEPDEFLSEMTVDVKMATYEENADPLADEVAPPHAPPPGQPMDVNEGTVIFDLNLRIHLTVGDDISVALVPYLCGLPSLYGQLHGGTISCTKLRIWWHLPEKKLRLAFCDRPSLELDDTHIQLPLFQPCIKKGLGDCQPLSHPAVVARVLESILAMVFKEKKPPRFDLRKKVSHWRTVRMIYQWYGAKGLKWRSQGAYHRLLNPQHELAQSALAEGLTGKRKKGIAQANWRALLLHAKKN